MDVGGSNIMSKRAESKKVVKRWWENVSCLLYSSMHVLLV
jgi:hypothetical protein